MEIGANADDELTEFVNNLYQRGGLVGAPASGFEGSINIWNSFPHITGANILDLV